VEEQTLWQDSLSEALEAVVIACGGAKDVGHAMWSTIDITDAGNKVKHCLSKDHNQKFSLDEIEFIFNLGGERGCLTGVSYINEISSCAPPVAVTKEDLQAQLQRQSIQAVKQLEGIVDRLSKLQGVG